MINIVGNGNTKLASMGCKPASDRWINRWSVSRIGKAQSCQRLIYLDAVLGFQAKYSTSAAIQGILTHVGVLEAYHQAGFRAVKHQLNTKALEIGKEQEFDVELLDVLKARIYTEGYAHWADAPMRGGPACDDPHDTLIGVEIPWTTTIDGHDFKGVFDMITYYSPTNTYRIHELKTTSRKEALDVGSSYWRDLTYGTQPVVYAKALMALAGHPLEGVKWPHPSLGKFPDAEIEFVYHIINTTKSKPGRKKPIRKRKAESDEEFLLRENENKETISEWYEKTLKIYLEDNQEVSRFLQHSFVLLYSEIQTRWDEILDVIRMTNSSRQFPRNPGSCGDFGGCAFRKVCSGDEDLVTSERLKRKKER